MLKTSLKHLPRKILLILATLASVANTEEESILAEATMLNHGRFRTDVTPVPEVLFGDGFKSFLSSSCCA